MRSRTALVGTLVLSLAIVATSPRLALSPGAVTRGHAEIAGDCLSCHAPFRGAPPAKCIQCHPLDSLGIARRGAVPPDSVRPALAGMHTGFGQANCLDCHTDHAGPDPAHATLAFSHEALSASQRQRCVGCHEGNRPADELHGTVTDDCASCHTAHAWRPATFAHEQYFVLDRDHDATCRTCHTEPFSYRQYTCYGCHEHTLSRIAAKHSEEGITNPRDCVRCHRSAGDHEGGKGHEGDEGGEGDEGRGDG